MLGIQDQFIPATWNDAYAQKAALLDPVIATTSEGLKLAQILINLGSEIDGGFVTTEVFEVMARYVLGDTYADMLALRRHPALDASVKMAFPSYIAAREFSLFFPFSPDMWNMFDEFVRQGALFYLSSGQTIDIVIPDGNRTSF